MSHRRIAGSEHNAAEVIGNERAHDNIEDPVGECVSEYHSGPDPFGVPMQDGGRGGCRGSGDAQRTCQSKAGKDGLRIHAAVGQRQDCRLWERRWQPPTGILNEWLPRGAFGRICITAWLYIPFPFRRSVSAGRISERSRNILSAARQKG